MFRCRIHPSPAGTCPEGELFSSWAISIEETPNPEPPHFPDRTRLFHICEEAPSVLPPECFPSTDWHANLQCGEENVASQHFTLLPHLLPPTATLPLLLFTDTAVQCQCVTSQTYRQSTPKQRKKEGRGECIPYVLRSPCPHLLPLFSWAVVGG